jgi:hypothetical protein
MAWQPTHQETITVAKTEKELFARRNPASAYLRYQFPTLKGIHRGGEFPVAVVRKTYEARGYECMVSAQSKHGIPCYLLERLPRIRRRRDEAYLRMEEAFGRRALERFHAKVAAGRTAIGLRSAGGDPDLFVVRRGNTHDRLFIEVKLDDPTGRRPYRDELGRQQHLVFPLIEAELGCEVRLTTVLVVKGDSRSAQAGGPDEPAG